MTRVKRGVISMKRRRNVLKDAKGYRFGRKSKERMAKEAVIHAGVYAFRDRRKKKNVMRRSWQVSINNAARLNGTTYSKLIDKLTKANIALDRKILAQLAIENPTIFAKILESVK